MSEGDAQGEHYEAIKHAVEKAIDKIYADAGCRRPEMPAADRRFDITTRRMAEASAEFCDHFARAGEHERIKRKARIYAQALFNEPGLQHAIGGFIAYLKQGEAS